MIDSTLQAVTQPDAGATDPLHELLRKGARDLIAKAVEAELSTFLEQYANKTLEDGRRAVVRNGYLPERTVQTGIGDVEVKVPRVRDRSGDGVTFSSALLPPYLKRARSIEELIPWLYLKGVSTGDYQEALVALLGDQAKGLSATTVTRLKKQWEAEHAEWQKRGLSEQRYVYWWADGVYSNVRMDDRLCLLVIIGVTEQGRKELVVVEDGQRESEASWKELLTGLRGRGLTTAPKLAVGDGAMGFWAALSKVYPETDHQRCWVHKAANVLNKLPKSVQPKVKADLHEIWMAETRFDALKDGVILRLIGKWLKAGVLEAGQWQKGEVGSPQDGVISPLLANVYLHYVLDEWFDKDVKPRLRGRAFSVRFADDAILAFSNEADARKVLEVLTKRFARFGLTLHSTKTRLVWFRPHREQRAETFGFLGFTFYWGKSRRGRLIIKQKTTKDRYKRGLKRISLWCRANRHRPLREQHRQLCRKVTRHYAYYGITNNIEALQRFVNTVRRIWIKWLRRRSQKGWFSWEKAAQLLSILPLPRARIIHRFT